VKRIPTWAWVVVAAVAVYLIGRRRSTSGWFAGGIGLDTVQGPAVALGVGLRSRSASGDDEGGDEGMLGGSSGLVPRNELPLPTLGDVSAAEAASSSKSSSSSSSSSLPPGPFSLGPPSGSIGGGNKPPVVLPKPPAPPRF
jgi:hypothetical protein